MDLNLISPKIAVIGSGAVGGYYGAMLARRGHDVHFLFHNDYAAVQQNGLTVLSPDGDFRLKVHAYDDSQKMPPADLVLIAMKTTQNHLLPALLAPIVHPGTVLLTLQNGLGNEQFLAEHFGGERVLGGMAFVCSNRESPGVVRHLKHGLITVGEYAMPPGERVTRIVRLIADTGVPCTVLSDLQRGRWEKLVWNIPFNGLGAALDLTTDRLIESEVGLALVKAVMGEVVTIAESLNLRYGPDLIEQKIAATREMGAYFTSMQIDRRSCRPMELDAIFRRALATALGQGIAAPRVTMLLEQLDVLQDSAVKDQTTHPA